MSAVAAFDTFWEDGRNGLANQDAKFLRLRTPTEQNNAAFTASAGLQFDAAVLFASVRSTSSDSSSNSGGGGGSGLVCQYRVCSASLTLRSWDKPVADVTLYEVRSASTSAVLMNSSEVGSVAWDAQPSFGASIGSVVGIGASAEFSFDVTEHVGLAYERYTERNRSSSSGSSKLRSEEPRVV